MLQSRFKTSPKQREKAQLYYSLNKDKVAARRKANRDGINKARRERRARYLDTLIELHGNKCADCQQSFIRDVYDFHHLDPSKKEAAISVLLGKASFQTVKEETAKCILLCSNCHRIRHAKTLL